MPREPRPDPLIELLDRARVEASASERARERSLRDQAVEGATFAGTLVDLAEQASPVTVRTVAGRTHRANIAAVGADFVLLRPATAEHVIVRLGALATVRAQPGARLEPATGDRAPSGARMLDVLAAMVPERPRVSIVTTGAVDPVRGDLVAVGIDVVTLRLEGDGARCAVRSSSVTEVTVALAR